jgi:hypothetical protein
VFRGPIAKRMTAEQFADAVSAVTGVWPAATKDMVQVDGRGQGGQAAAVRAAIAATEAPRSPGPASSTRIEAQWVWSHADAEHDPGGRILLRKVIRLDAVPESAVAVAACDNELTLFVNGREVGRSDAWTRPVAVDVTRLLKKGENVVAAEATNWPDAENRRGTDIRGANPAAFIAWVGGTSHGKQEWGVGTDASWLWAKKARGAWKAASFRPDGWSHAVELPTAARIYGGQVDLAGVVERLRTHDDGTPVRAALEFDDPLLTALGRTSREQVVTRRDPVATTLQALELTNGTTLDGKLRSGAEHWVGERPRGRDELVRDIFRAALGRPPAPDEVRAALDLVGPTPTVEGVQDLLWAIVMLPEFQVIR